LRHHSRRPLGVLLGAALLSVAGDGITQVGVRDKLHSVLVLGTAESAFATGALGLPAATVIFGGVYLLVTVIPAVFPLYRQMSETARQPVI
jgi:hypothetical protein